MAPESGTRTLHARVYAALAVLLVGATAVAGVAVTGLRTVSRTSSSIYADNLVTNQMLVDLQTSVEQVHDTGFALLLARDDAARRIELQELLTQAVPAVDVGMAGLSELRDGGATRADEVPAVRRLWTKARSQLVLDAVTYSSSARVPYDGERLTEILRPVADAIQAVRDREVVIAGRRQADADRHGASTTRSLLVLTALVLLAGLAAAVLLVRVVRGSLREAERRRRDEQSADQVQAELTEALQAADDQGEAQRLLRRHVERTVPGSHAVVLNRNNSANRLTSVTPLDESCAMGAVLASTLPDAEPRSCLAVRFGRPHAVEPGVEPLLPCTVCDRVPGSTSCQPLLVAGQVIGSVLVQGPDRPLLAAEDAVVRVAVGRAAPVLANLRNLALAEVRAATDQLTGMPNNRSAQETLLRMVAQSGRAMRPLSAVMLDLDHFKAVNDGWGHPKGDEVLAAVAAAMRVTVRRSDFVGRYGGEEFMALLPDTDRDGAMELAEKLRVAVAQVVVVGVDRDITISAGVATMPDDAVDGPRLVRAADRALYAAKANGRNRVEAFGVVTGPVAAGHVTAQEAAAPAPA